jgi:hypothetical protein
VTGARFDGGAISALTLVGTVAGALGALGIGFGLAAAETLARSARAAVVTLGGAAGGGLMGGAAHLAARTILAGVFGRDVPAIAGSVEGAVLGALLGLGYAAATRGLVEGGMAAPQGAARWRAALITGAVSAAGGIALAATGHHLVGTSLDMVAGLFAGSHVGLAPLAGLLGEGTLRPLTQMVVSAFEAFMLGLGVSYGLMRRPRSQPDQPI